MTDLRTEPWVIEQVTVMHGVRRHEERKAAHASQHGAASEDEHSAAEQHEAPGRRVNPAPEAGCGGEEDEEGAGPGPGRSDR